MISAGDFRKGITFQMDDDVYQIIDFQHVKPGKGAAFVRTKIRSVMSGTIKDFTFNPSDRYARAIINNQEMEYLYNDGELYYFMDTETYDQIPMDKEVLGEAMMYIKDNDIVTIRFFQGKAFEVVPPNFVELEVTATEPGIKGDTSSGAVKPATLETGVTLNVPLFVNLGDIIKVDTRTGEYLSRI